MAEPSLKGKLPGETYRPSRLRHEVQVESDGGEDVSEAGAVQAPDSQIMILETQLHHHHDNEANPCDPLSPSSAETLDRYGVKKSTEIAQAIKFPAKLFSKDAAFGGGSTVSLSVPSFSFGRPENANKKTPTKVDTPSAKPATECTTSVHLIEPAFNPVTCPPSSPLPTVADEPPELPSDAGDGPFVNNCARSPSGVLAAGTIIDENKTCKQRPDGSPDLPPSTQSAKSGSSTLTQVQTVQKQKRTNKGGTHKYRGLPWPPRPKPVVVEDSTPSPAHNDGLEERSRKLMASLPIGSEVHTSLDHGTTLESHEDGDRLDSKQIDQSFQNDSTPVSLPNTHEIGNVSSGGLRASRVVSNAVADDSITIATQPTLDYDRPSSAHARKQNRPRTLPVSQQNHAQNADAWQRHHVISYEDRVDDLDNAQTGDLRYTLPEPCSTPFTHADTQAKHLLPLEKSVLHTVADSNHYYRVGKAQRKQRTLDGSKHATSTTIPLHGGTFARDDFDQTLEGLREAHHAEKSRREHEVTTQNKHFEEVKALLQDQVRLYSVMAVEWKAKHDALHESTTQLRAKAKTNQKYVAGLQADHEKMQKSTIAFQDECREILQLRVAEMEREKAALQSELEITLQSLEKGQQTMKATIEQLYVHIITSESKRKHLADSLVKQVSMYEEEKTRRRELETNIFSSLQSVELQLSDHSNQLVRKLDNLQSSVDVVASDLTHDTGVEECLTVLQKLQQKPFDSGENLERMEQKLNSVHGDLGSKLDSLEKAVQMNTNPKRDVQDFIRQELQDLRNEILKFEGLAAETREVQASKTAADGELKAERRRADELSQQLGHARRVEDELKSRQAALESQLAEAAKSACKHSIESAAPELEILREKILVLESECRTAKTSVERTQQNIQKRDRKIEDYEVSVMMLKHECELLREEVKQERAKQKVRMRLPFCFRFSSTVTDYAVKPNMDSLRGEIQKTLQEDFARKESDYRNEAHRLVRERDDMKTLVDQHSDKINAAKMRCEQARKDGEDIKAELEAAHKAKTDLQAKYEALQSTIRDQPTREIADLEQELKQKSEELSAKFKEYCALETELAQSQSQQRDLRVELEGLQSEALRHSSLLDSMREEAGTALQKERVSSQATIQSAQNRTIVLEKEKEDLLAKLEQARLTEEVLRNSRGAVMTEKHSMQLQINELGTEKQELMSKMRGVDDEIALLRQQKQHLDSAFKDIEARLQRETAEHTKKLDFDRQKYEAVILGLQEEMKKLNQGAADAGGSRSRPLHSSAQEHLFSIGSHEISTGKGRKKANRGNNSVLNVFGMPGTLVQNTEQNPTNDGNAPTRRYSNNLFDEHAYESDFFEQLLDDQGLSVVDAAAENVDETQDIFSGILPFEEQFPHCEVLPETQNRMKSLDDSSSLSECLRSDEISHLGGESQPLHRASHVTTPIPHVHDHISAARPSSQERILETPIRPAQLSRSSFDGSQSSDRPRSQANTASRLMPPPGSKSSQFDQRKPSPVMPEPSSHVDQADGKSLPVPKTSHRDQSMAVQKHGHNSKRDERDNVQENSEDLQHTSTISGTSYSHKRRSTYKPGPSQKRHRTSSQSLSLESSIVSRTHVPQHAREKLIGSSATSDAQSISSKQSSMSSVSPAGKFSSRRSQPTSSELGRRSAYRLTPSKSRTPGRTSQTAALRFPATRSAPRTYSHHQTRSKTQDIERFDQEINGL
ncbi:hypothetical protein ACEQ8H_003460 [Pleosporales sp. CAS-2024a]